MLESILKNINQLKKTYNFILFCDQRAPLSRFKVVLDKIYFIQPTIFGRLSSELHLKKIASKSHIIMNLGNLPPIFRLPSKTILFIQNRLIVNNPLSLIKRLDKTSLRLLIEYFWLKIFRKNVDEFVVQTASMKEALKEQFNIKIPIIVKPFIPKEKIFQARNYKRISNQYDFVYVASAENHKNHINLLKAWLILAEEGIHPSLCLTINKIEFNRLTRSLPKKLHNVLNAGKLTTRSGIKKLYLSSKALIYPSLHESMGLPLIEASNFGLPILAGELDYVRDIINPNETFNPLSHISIAKAVKRFLKIPAPLPHLISSDEFLKQTLNINTTLRK